MTDSPVTLGSEFIQDRHALYTELREERPVCPVVMPDGLRVWLVTRYEDAREALVNPLLSKDSRRARPLHDQQEAEGVRRTFLAEVLESHLLNLDPPDHTRLRKLVTREFTHRRVELLRPWTAGVVSELLDGLSGRDEFDVLGDFALPLTVNLVGELFGVPVQERTPFRALSNEIAFGDPATAGQASAEMADYLAGLIARKRTSTDEDLLTALVQARDEDRLSEVELVSMAFLMLTAGYESTGNLIGNGVVGLLTHPDQLAALRADPASLPAAVEELLRHDGPAGTTTLRFTTAPVQIGDVQVPEGEFVLMALGSANRDSRRFEDADRLDLGRNSQGHLGFGHGVHHCLGAPLARLAGQEAIGGLLRRFPDVVLAPGELEWRDSVLFRGYRRIPVKLA